MFRRVAESGGYGGLAGNSEIVDFFENENDGLGITIVDAVKTIRLVVI